MVLKTFGVLGISYKEHLTEEVDGTVSITHEETGHQVQVNKAGKPGFSLTTITVKTARPTKKRKRSGKGVCSRGERKGTAGHGGVSPIGNTQKRMWRRQGRC